MPQTIATINQAGIARDDRWLLRFINWEIKAGERWALMGLNGSGKTTLMQLLNGYLWPMEGQISLFGLPLGSCDLREIRPLIGYSGTGLADMIHFDDTVQDIVAGGCFASIGLFNDLTSEQDQRTQEMLQAFALEKLAHHPYGTLSQGERQRTAIARALASQPRLLILDEPCSGLDFLQREHLLELLHSHLQANPSLALIYITHRPEEIISEIDHVLFLKDGMILGKGPADELLTAPHLSLLYGRKVKVDQSDGRRWVKPA